jgi:hypothetical protein
VATTVARSIDRRWQILEQAAADPEFRQLVAGAQGQPRGSPARDRLQSWLEKTHREHPIVDTDSWFLAGADGRQLARSPLQLQTLDQSYSHRDYFHGQGIDLAAGASGVKPIEAPHLSMVFLSDASGERTVVLSVPVWDGDTAETRSVIGVLGHAVGLGHFAELRADERSGNQQLAVLVDAKPDDTGRKGAILEHPGLTQVLKHPPKEGLELHVDPQTASNIESLRALRREPETSQSHAGEAQDLAWIDNYRDPAGAEFAGRWLAAVEPVEVLSRPLPSRDTGWAIIVQEKYRAAVEPVQQLRDRLLWQSKLALLMALIVISGLWGFVIFVLNESPRWRWFRHWWRRTTHAAGQAEGSSLPSGDSGNPSVTGAIGSSADGSSAGISATGLSSMGGSGAAETPK